MAGHTLQPTLRRRCMSIPLRGGPLRGISSMGGGGGLLARVRGLEMAPTARSNAASAQDMPSWDRRAAPRRRGGILGAGLTTVSLNAHIGCHLPTPAPIGTFARSGVGAHVQSTLDFSPSAVRRSAVQASGGAVDTGKETEATRLAALEAAVAHHAYQYHSLGAAEISDDAFDSLKRELEELRAHQVGGGGSPPPSPLASEVGAPPSGALLKVTHDPRMLSLGVVVSGEELYSWWERTRKLVPAAGEGEVEIGWVVEPKVDGLAVKLSYDGATGELEMAATRGNGALGEDVTQNIRLNCMGVPHRITPPPGFPPLPATLEVRGEVYMGLEDFEELNRGRGEAGEKPFANPRNAAAGSLRLLDAEEAAKRPLRFAPYALVVPGDAGGEWMRAAGITSQWGALEAIGALGFPVNADSRRFDGLDGAAAYVEEWHGRRSGLGYEADGAVIKMDPLALHAALGDVGGDPRWAVAWKFPAAEAVTVLEGIDFTVGRTGQVVPTCVLRPVSVGGVTIRQATLHNVGYVRKRDFRVGDTVVVRRAGDVIPQVMRPLLELRDGSQAPCEFPTVCPCARQEPLTPAEDNDDVLYCTSAACPQQSLRRLEHFVAVCMRGVGKGVVKQLVESGVIKDPSGLYLLQVEDLLALDGFKEARARNVIGAIQASKGAALPVFLHSLGIRHMGLGKAELVAAHFGTLEALREADEEDVMSVQGLGPVIAISIIQWLKQPSSRALLDRLVASGAGPIEGPGGEHAAAGGGGGGSRAPGTAAARGEGGGESAASPIAGKAVVVTGSWGGMTREDVQAIVAAAGGKPRPSVTKATDILAKGNKPGKRKCEKAEELGVEIVTVEELLAMCGRGGGGEEEEGQV